MLSMASGCGHSGLTKARVYITKASTGEGSAVRCL